MTGNSTQNKMDFTTSTARPMDKECLTSSQPSVVPIARNFQSNITRQRDALKQRRFSSNDDKRTAHSISIAADQADFEARAKRLRPSVASIRDRHILPAPNQYPAAEEFQKHFAERSKSIVSLNEHLVQNDCLSVPESTTHWLSLQSGGVTHSSFLEHAMTTMAHNPSPTPSSELQYGLHHLVDHNTSPQYEWQDDSGYIYQSQPSSSYASPSLMPHSFSPPATHPYMHSPLMQSASYGEDGLGIQYAQSPTTNPGHYASEQSPYYYAPPLTHDGSPLTPRSMPSDASRRTRSGFTVARSNSPQILRGDTSGSRVTKSPKAKKPKANKAANTKTPALDGPLSEMTKDMVNVPVRDMEAWVKRSTEQRELEVEKRNGYVTRPMNSFMLYRSAYSERTKMWCLQNNHQVVSSVSGASWPLESDALREHYNDLAQIERENHARAHPKYKFSPSKSTAAAIARKKKACSSDDEASDIEDPDWDWRPRGARATSRRPGREAGYPSNHSPNVSFEEPLVLSTSHSPWEVPAEFKSPSIAVQPNNLMLPYYQMPYSMDQRLPTSTSDHMRLETYPSEIPSGIPNQQPDMFYTSGDRYESYQTQVDPMLLQLDGQDHTLYEPFQMEPPSQFEEWMEEHSA